MLMHSIPSSQCHRRLYGIVFTMGDILALFFRWAALIVRLSFKRSTWQTIDCTHRHLGCMQTTENEVLFFLEAKSWTTRSSEYIATSTIEHVVCWHSLPNSTWHHYSWLVSPNEHAKKDTNRYKNQLWNKVGIKAYEQDHDREGMTTTSRHSHIYHEVWLLEKIIIVGSL